mmetsp:Transcript_26961/g.88467  ORF Transcript_26961/g.88467 Transcript_26961/m.88467 type:complete len:253 (+) Transcript_26961:758-1516(+)
MFCIEHSRRPPREAVAPGYATSGVFFVRLMSSPGRAPFVPAASAPPIASRSTYKTLVLAGKADSDEPSAAACSMWSLENSVYSTLLTLYSKRVLRRCELGSNFCTRRSTSTLAPSDAPTVRSHDAKPNARLPLHPIPARERSVQSVPARGLEIWRTTPARRPCSRRSQRSTPASLASFQITPCPPGFISSWSAPGDTHLPPPNTAITGTSGCLKSRNDRRPRPNQRSSSHKARTRRWLPLACEVMIATGVVT